MTKVQERQIEQAERGVLANTPPDSSGWTDEEKLVWAARNGRYEAIVARAIEGWQPNMATVEEGEGPSAVGQGSDGAEVTQAAEFSDGSPAAAPPPQPEAERQPEYWEEKCQWRHRGPEDYDWDDRPRGYECEHEYDPLEQGWQEIVRSWRSERQG